MAKALLDALKTHCEQTNDDEEDWSVTTGHMLCEEFVFTGEYIYGEDDKKWDDPESFIKYVNSVKYVEPIESKI